MKTRPRTGSRVSGDKSQHKYPSLSRFARDLLIHWRRLQLPVSNVTAIVAVSGGADSAALLLAFDELVRAKKLEIEIIVAHVDHRLRKASADDARWVRDLARRLGYEFSISRINVRSRQDNLEQAARAARYKAFAALAQSVARPSS